MFRTLLQDKTTALLAIVVTVCLTALVALGKLTVSADQLKAVLAFLFGGPLVSSGLNKIYNSTPVDKAPLP